MDKCNGCGGRLVSQVLAANEHLNPPEMLVVCTELMRMLVGQLSISSVEYELNANLKSYKSHVFLFFFLFNVIMKEVAHDYIAL